MKNGDRITITYLTPCVNGGGDPNPYIGMSGEVRDYNGKTFNLFTGSSWVVGIEYCRYRPTDIPKCGYFEKKEDVSVGRPVKCSLCGKYPYNVYYSLASSSVLCMQYRYRCSYCVTEKTHGKLSFCRKLKLLFSK